MRNQTDFPIKLQYFFGLFGLSALCFFAFISAA